MRLALGAIMVVHGYHKVFGGLHHHAQMVAGVGLPAWLGYVSSFTEFLGGLLILVGFFTRPASFAVCLDLSVAIWKVHLHNGIIGSPGRDMSSPWPPPSSLSPLFSLAVVRSPSTTSCAAEAPAPRSADLRPPCSTILRNLFRRAGFSLSGSSRLG